MYSPSPPHKNWHYSKCGKLFYWNLFLNWLLLIPIICTTEYNFFLLIFSIKVFWYFSETFLVCFHSPAYGHNSKLATVARHVPHPLVASSGRWNCSTPSQKMVSTAAVSDAWYEYTKGNALALNRRNPLPRIVRTIRQRSSILRIGCLLSVTEPNTPVVWT